MPDVSRLSLCSSLNVVTCWCGFEIGTSVVAVNADVGRLFDATCCLRCGRRSAGGKTTAGVAAVEAADGEVAGGPFPTVDSILTPFDEVGAEVPIWGSWCTSTTSFLRMFRLRRHTCFVLPHRSFVKSFVGFFPLSVSESGTGSRLMGSLDAWVDFRSCWKHFVVWSEGGWGFEVAVEVTEWGSLKMKARVSACEGRLGVEGELERWGNDWGLAWTFSLLWEALRLFRCCGTRGTCCTLCRCWSTCSWRNVCRFFLIEASNWRLRTHDCAQHARHRGAANNWQLPNVSPLQLFKEMDKYNHRCYCSCAKNLLISNIYIYIRTQTNK